MSLTNRTLWHIETDLTGPLSLDGLARAAGASPFHLARAFRAATGTSVMGYVRARRLSEAARRLGPDGPDILSVALAAGYGSHEAFTRAFAAQFGCTPSAVRRGHATPIPKGPLRMSDTLTHALTTPRREMVEPFAVTGLSLSLDRSEIAAIPALWQRFNDREDEIPDPVLGVAYGICHGSRPMHYTAGIRSHSARLPSGMDRVEIPAGPYAVWTFRGHVSDVQPFIAAIWDRGLVDAGLTPRQAPEWELYDARFDAVSGRGTIEIWVPVA